MTTLTGDLGLAIRDFIEGKEFHLFDGEGDETGVTDIVEYVECSDANCLKVLTASGAHFTVQISRTA